MKDIEKAAPVEDESADVDFADVDHSKYPSIYEMIKAELDAEGRLPDDFLLLAETMSGNLELSPGALDGLLHYHVEPHKSKKKIKQIVNLLRKYCRDAKPDDVRKLLEVLSECQMIGLVDSVLDKIREQRDSFNADRLLHLGLTFTKNSDHAEMAKFGLSLLGLFEVGDVEPCADMVLTLGAHDEFTFFAIMAASDWKDGNALIFELAKKVKGWGKIHAVRYLDPETDEIKDWLLRHGCDNIINNAYLALDCAEGGDLITALRGDDLDEGLFDGVCTIISALLNEGLVGGISEYEHAGEALTLFVKHAFKRDLTLKQLWHVLNLLEWLEVYETDPENPDEATQLEIDEVLLNRKELRELCQEMTRRKNYLPEINDAIAGGEGDQIFYAVNSASRLDVDVDEQLFATLEKDPLKHCEFAQYLYPYPEYAEKLTAKYEELLPLDDLSSKESDMPPSLYAQTVICLECLMPELRDYPLMGQSLVMAALNSPSLKLRFAACTTLEQWLNRVEKPFSEIAPDLAAELRQSAAAEDDAELAKHILKFAK